jgi:hypothetical protein
LLGAQGDDVVLDVGEDVGARLQLGEGAVPVTIAGFSPAWASAATADFTRAPCFLTSTARSV